MTDIKRIIKTIDEFLELKNLKSTTPVEINPYLEKKGLLKNSHDRPGLPVRRLLRKGLIPHAYRNGVNWLIPHSLMKNEGVTKPIERKKTNIPSTKTVLGDLKRRDSHKLLPVAVVIIELIKERYNESPQFRFEFSPDWLHTYPSIQLIKKWPEINQLYSELVDHKFDLEERVNQLPPRRLNQKQAFDIWIGEPFNFAVEFDESQHFNQFRRISINFYDNIKVNYPLGLYKQLNRNDIINPGKSGFTKLKSNDPLFPELVNGERQDNRVRQRAFRDFLKDLLPLEYGLNPTLRIPYQMTSYKIKNFTELDLDNLRSYLVDNALL